MSRRESAPACPADTLRLLLADGTRSTRVNAGDDISRRRGRQPDPWTGLRSLTTARIALGRAGGSVPTPAMLDFQLAHAAARDAVHAEFNPESIRSDILNLKPGIQASSSDCLIVRSAAPDSETFLLRPDLGRRLDDLPRRRRAWGAPAAGPGWAAGRSGPRGALWEGANRLGVCKPPAAGPGDRHFGRPVRAGCSSAGRAAAARVAAAADATRRQARSAPRGEGVGGKGAVERTREHGARLRGDGTRPSCPVVTAGGRRRTDGDNCF